MKIKQIKNKKIGLVTWYDRGGNYGSTLQAFATQTFLENNGYECELINYKPESHNVKRNVKELLKKMYLFLFNKKVLKKWNKIKIWIKNNINESKKITSYKELEEYAKDYCAIICGSDQIWNNANNIVNPFNYLQFVNKKKRIAYAPSIARDYIDEKIKDTFAKYINEIKYLSIREQQGASLIKDITGREAKVVLDPTFLISKEEWKSKIQNLDKKLIEEPYIFVYFLSKNEMNFKLVAEFAKSRGLRIVTTPAIYDENNFAEEADCSEFLNLINNAEYVATDSFHGVAFSINFEKEFVVFKRFKDEYKETQNSRIYNILNELELNSRLATSENDMNMVLKEPINYSSVKKILKNLVEESKKYLLTSIEEVLQEEK